LQALGTVSANLIGRGVERCPLRLRARPGLARFRRDARQARARPGPAKWFGGAKAKGAGRFKLFTERNLRDVVLGRLTSQFSELGMCRANPKVRLCLACGKIQDRAREPLAHHFKANDWDLLERAGCAQA
jgi:hypothetical protein